MSEMISMKCGCEFENGQAVADKVRMKGFADREMPRHRPNDRRAEGRHTLHAQARLKKRIIIHIICLCSLQFSDFHPRIADCCFSGVDDSGNSRSNN